MTRLDELNEEIVRLKTAKKAAEENVDHATFYLRSLLNRLVNLEDEREKLAQGQLGFKFIDPRPEPEFN